MASPTYTMKRYMPPYHLTLPYGRERNSLTGNEVTMEEADIRASYQGARAWMQIIES